MSNELGGYHLCSQCGLEHQDYESCFSMLKARVELLSQQLYELKFCIKKIRAEVDHKVVDRWARASLSFKLEVDDEH